MKRGNDDLSGVVIGAAIRVHETLGSGYLESVYEEAVCVELSLLGVNFSRRHPIAITYRDRVVGEHRLDLLVESKIVVELKTVVGFDPIHFATLQIKRVGREWHSRAE